MKSSILFQTLLPPASVRLGRLVLNTRSPHQDFLDPFDEDDRPSPKECILSTHLNFEETRKFSKSSKLRSYFNDVLSVSYQSHSLGIASISAPQVTTHDLKNSGIWFRDACAVPETRTWLEGAIDNGDTVHLIVGYRTVLDARLAQSASSLTTQGARAQAPASVLTGVGTPVDILPGAEGLHDTAHERSMLFDAPGEQVFAVRYRKIKFKWLSSRKIENIVLEDTRWKAYWDSRGTEVDDEEDEDVLEVNLTDVSDYDISDDEYFCED